MRTFRVTATVCVPDAAVVLDSPEKCLEEAFTDDQVVNCVCESLCLPDYKAGKLSIDVSAEEV